MFAWIFVALLTVLLFVRAKSKINSTYTAGGASVGPKDLEVWWHYGVATGWSLVAALAVAIFQ